MTEDRPTTRPFALLALALATLWLLAGAGFKLFLGTPADLPEIMHGLPFDLGLTYKLAIGTELLFVVLAIGAPRIGWIAIAAIYVVFEVILGLLINEGAESCGCFGSKVTILPAEMMLYDGILLGLLLISQPWKGTAPGFNKLFVSVACVLAMAVPFLLDREVDAPPPAPVDENTEPVQTFNRPFAVLDIESWVGMSVYDTPLVNHLEQDIGMLPTEGMWVLWRWTCDHCALHLEDLAKNPPAVPFITLIRIKEEIDNAENQAVHIMPNGPEVVEASLPSTVDYAIQTPGEMILEGSMIISASEDVGH